MLRLIWTRKRDPSQYGSVLGDPEAIRDLYWQLTHNYRAQDGTAIGDMQVLNIGGEDVTDSVMTNPHGCCVPASNFG